MGERRDKAVSLFSYLRAVAGLRLRPVLDVTGWEQIIWIDDLSAAPNSSTRLTSNDLDDWVRVERPAASPPPPRVPALLDGMVDLHEVEDWTGTPRLVRGPLAESGPSPAGADPDSGRLTADPNNQLIRETWRAYEDQWLEWAAEREEIEPAHDVYRKFFHSHNRAEQLGEQYEVVVGVGLLSWRLPEVTIRRHLVTAPASLTYDADSGLISVAPSGLSSQQFSLEDDMVPPSKRPTPVHAEIQAAVGEADTPFDESIEIALTRWVQAADESGVFSQALDAPGAASPRPEIRLAPAVILRQRRQASLRRTYDEIISQLTEGSEIPATVADLVDDTSDGQHVDAASDPVSFGFEPEEHLFFPLPTNPQQRRIVSELSRRRGVVVQGPPGTGKSHTIANLISHYLATGKRILVTSHTERALRVVKEKLPEDIRDLTVSVLGAGRQGAEDLARSANALLGRRNDPNWSVDRLNAQISQWAEKLELAQRTRDGLHEKLSRLQAAASQSHQLKSGYSGPIGEIAQQLAAEQDAHGWLPDRVSDEMPIRHNELVELHSLAESVGTTDPTLASMYVPPPAELPTVEDLITVQQVTEESHRLLDTATGDTATAERLRNSPIDLQDLAVRLRDHVNADKAARRRSETWLVEALDDWDAGRTSQWDDLRERTRSYLDHTYAHNRDDVRPSDVDSARLHILGRQAADLVAHFEKGGRLAGLLGQRTRAAKRNSEALACADRLNLEVGDLDSAREFRALLEEVAHVTTLASQWRTRADLSQGMLRDIKAHLRDHLTTLEHLEAVSQARLRISEVVAHIVGDPVDTAEDVAELHEALQLAEALEAKDRTQERRRALKETLASSARANAHPSFQQLFRAAEDLQIDEYQDQLAELKELHEQQCQLKRFRHLHDSLGAVAPKFAEAVAGWTVDVAEADAVDRAWRWSWAMSEVEQLRNRSESRLIEDLHRADEEIANYTATLASARAWRNTLDGMSEYQTTELKAYQQALRRLGKGLGKRAATHRSDAQRHLANCQTAVRAWIMPTYRVAETLRAEMESFDVVIVDEASQSGVDALFLFWLGKQIVIVGDDNQISPSNVGISAESVAALQRQYLASLKLSDLLGIDNSLFDQAMVRYSGEVWLTEHFRCMPEIIEFSNQLLYAPKHRRLEPLRQFGDERLPPLERCFVPHGRREGAAGRFINRAEARELIDTLIRCHSDPRYEGLSFGVIGLLGKQAQYIEAQLLERLPNEAWIDRQLRCGDAYDFQGDERDVIFLSMVTSLQPNQNTIPALGHRSAEQRYNVAASRARDQVWLFHSMALEELNPACVRHKLLNHFVAPPEAGIVSFEDLVTRDSSHPEFGSLFEQRVFLDIRERGYIVRPQVEAYGYRIDIVVAGSHRKLAVECDGAAWHGPDRYAEDLVRQKDLERAGWTFCRIRDTDYYLNPEEALQPLWGMLHEYKIHPQGMGEAPSEDVALLAPRVGSSPTVQASAVPIDPQEQDHRDSENHVQLPLQQLSGIGKGGRDRASELLSNGDESLFRTVGQAHTPRTSPVHHEATGDPEEPTESDANTEPTESHLGVTMPPTRSTAAEQGAPNQPLIAGQEDALRSSEVGSPSDAARSAANRRFEESRRSHRSTEEHSVRQGPAMECPGHIVYTPGSPDRRSEQPNPPYGETEPYTEWRGAVGSPLPQLSRDELMQVLVEIIEVEGPIVTERAYRLANNAAGAQKLGRNIRSALNRALTWGVRQGLVVQADPLGHGDDLRTTLRMHHQPVVRIRSRGPRKPLQHIPPEELRVALHSGIRQNLPAEERYRAVLEQYEFSRLTQAVQAHLRQCEQLPDPLDS